MFVDTISYGLFKTSENNPGLTQRDLVRRLGICIGNIEPCLQALAGKGHQKIDIFRGNKLAYFRLSILHGFEQKAHMTQHSLYIKMQKYEHFSVEMAELKRKAVHSAVTV